MLRSQKFWLVMSGLCAGLHLAPALAGELCGWIGLIAGCVGMFTNWNWEA